MPYKESPKNPKCVINTDTNKEVGCTTGDVNDYIKSIYANVYETTTNKIKGGKADKMTPKDIAKKFDIELKDVNKQIKKGKKIESEHTKNEGEETEIAMDHLSEYPDYYDRLEKMEKKAEKYWSKKTKVNEGTKSLIKRILRENIE